jgi:hypothetical protein
MPKSPTRSSSRNSKNEGFVQLPPTSHLNPRVSPAVGDTSDEHIVNIPLTPIQTNVSTGARREGQALDPDFLRNSDEKGQESFHRGRRRARDDTGFEEDGALTTMGRFYEKVLNFSILTRYLLYIIPLGLFFLIFIVIGVTRHSKNAWTIGGVPIQWFFIWVRLISPIGQ